MYKSYQNALKINALKASFRIRLDRIGVVRNQFIINYFYTLILMAVGAITGQTKSCSKFYFVPFSC